MWYGKTVSLETLIGKTFISVTKESRGADKYDNPEAIIFKVSDTESYSMHHDQDCCESVRVEEIYGDLADLVGSPIIKAEESSNHTTGGVYGDQSQTWTFYHLSTAKGTVTIRWHGSSNGYYSESVDLHWAEKPDEY